MARSGARWNSRRVSRTASAVVRTSRTAISSSIDSRVISPPAGATRASAAASSGYLEARMTDSAPPSEFPTTNAGAFTTCRQNACRTSSCSSSASGPDCGKGEKPFPGRSTA